MVLFDSLPVSEQALILLKLQQRLVDATACPLAKSRTKKVAQPSTSGMISVAKLARQFALCRLDYSPSDQCEVYDALLMVLAKIVFAYKLSPMWFIERRQGLTPRKYVGRVSQ
jgi:hypothetical protein